ncbi:LOW QUALITY PROTEIN: uncharacterized protein LOC119945793 [Tachyglossus aculeatus]|uniref:LOW QUALITY PROTEIN: uncharacterized protein LOC119945793 n=1 Tax=Tachyglossus aculeatus TaxID=9261 RepID=UPI0018F38D90|nr:LOW QUALITY PROTEIN: uncharacterized protein LOC119945793 [Tachyglossus aculeatus]
MLLLLLTLFWGRSLSRTPEFALRVPESVTVQEGLCVSIPCTFIYPENFKNNHTAYGYWYQKGDKSKKELVASNRHDWNKQWRSRDRFHLIGDLQRDECSLHISDANVWDNGRFMFRVEKAHLRYLYKEHSVNVTVTALTQEPEIHLPAILESGRSVILNCTASWACEQAPPPTFFWTAPVFSPARSPHWSSSLGPPFFSVLPLTLGPQDHGANLTCHVTFPGAGVSTQSTVRLNVSYAPENLTFTVHRMNRSDIALSSSGNASSLTVLEGEHLRLACAADSNPPATLSWSHEGLGLGLSPSPDPGVSKLDLPRIGVRDGGKYTCQAQHPLGSRWISLHLSVHFPPRLVNSSCSRDEEGLHCSCAILANPPPTLRWWVGGQPVSENSSGRDPLVTSRGSGPWVNSTLSLRGVLEPGFHLLCEGTNPHGTHGLTILLVSDPKPLITNPFANGVTLAAIGGAGVMTLLSLCLILLIVKILRKKKEATGSGVTKSQGVTKVDCADLPSKSAPSDQPWEAEPGSPMDFASSADLFSDEARMEELHYASLTFLGLKPRETQASREPNTEYSEIKFRYSTSRSKVSPSLDNLSVGCIRRLYRSHRVRPGKEAWPPLSRALSSGPPGFSSSPDMLLLLMPLFWGGSLSHDKNFQLDIPNSVTVEVGLCVLIPCTFIYPWSFQNTNEAFAYWFQEEDGSKGDPVATNDPSRPVKNWSRDRFKLAGNPQMDNCSLSIDYARFGDSGKYLFRVEKGLRLRYEFLEYKVFVNVTALTKVPEIDIPETLESGHPVNVTCSAPWVCGRTLLPTFSWIWRGLYQCPGTPQSSVFLFTPGPQDHGTNLTCRVTIPGAATAEKTVRLNVSYAPQDLTIQALWENQTSTAWDLRGTTSSLTALEGESLRLICSSKGNPPADLRWTRKGRGLKLSHSWDPGVLELLLPYLGEDDEGEYTCHAQNPLGTRNVSLNLSVHYPPRLLNSSCLWDLEGLNCNCSTQAKPPPSLRWWVGGEAMEGNSSGNPQVSSTKSGLWTVSTLSLKWELDDGFSLRCEGSNPHGAHTLTLLPGPDLKTSLMNQYAKGMSQGIIYGVGITVLVSLGLFLFTVKMLKKKGGGSTTEASKLQDNTEADYINLVSNDLPPDQHRESRPDNPCIPHSPAAICRSEVRGDELHYSSLKFLGRKTREVQLAKTPSTEYSELNFR